MKTDNSTTYYVIHAVPVSGSHEWQWVSKEAGMPFTTEEKLIRRYKTIDAADRAMAKLRKTSPLWVHVGNACETYAMH